MNTKGQPVVGIVLNSPYAGGSELAMVETIKGLFELGYQLHIILPEEGPLSAYILPYAASVHYINHNWWASGKPGLGKFKRIWFLKGYYQSAKRMVATFKAHAVEVVITNSVVIPTGALAAKMAKLKHVWYLHEFGAEDHGLVFWYGQQRSFKLINRLSDHCVANSQAVYEYFNRYIPTPKLTKVYYAIDMPNTAIPIADEFLAKKDLTCIVTGRIASGKGQLDAVQALQIVRGTGIDAKLNLQGTADEVYKATIIKYLEAHNLTDFVHFLPHSPDPHQAVKQADIALVCSRLEAFGRVTVEAMKLGVPLIATATAGSLEIIGANQERGLLYQPEDAQGLANQILDYYNKPDLRYQKVVAAHQWAWDNCNSRNHAQQIDTILQKVAQ